MDIYIYKLNDPRNGKTRYIGKTKIFFDKVKNEYRQKTNRPIR